MLNTPETGGFIFDTSCLNYFALTGNAFLLEQRYQGHAFVSRHVIQELRDGSKEHPELNAILAADWFEVLRLEEPEDLVEFNKLLRCLGHDKRNQGEAATIVLAKRFNIVAVIDELVGRNFALGFGIEITGIVGILARMARDGQLTEAGAWSVHQEMVSINPNGFRSPISGRADFRKLCLGIV